MAYLEKRTTADGKTRYRVLVRLKGYPTQTATFKRKTDAQKWGQHTEAAIREGRHFKGVEAKRHTLGDLVDRYVRDVAPRRPKSQERKKQQMEWWREQLGDYVLADITPARLAECRDRLYSESYSRGPKSEDRTRSEATVNRYMAVLSHAFTMAVNEWGWIEYNPLRKVSRLKEPRGRVRFLSDTERDALLEACKASEDPCLYTVVLLALSCGMRKMEILRLTWDDVDLERRLIFVHETKNEESRGVPLVGRALEQLRAFSKVRRIDTRLLFPAEGYVKKPVDIRVAWESALKKAGIEDFRFHDLRHSCASYLAMNGATLAEIADVLGHKTLAMVKRYSHLTEAHTSRVVERMNRSIFGPAEGEHDEASGH